MKAGRPRSWLLGAACLILVSTGHATPATWQATRAEAVEAARNSGRLLLLLAGRDTCGNCTYMKNTVCEAPEVRALIDDNFVCWYCPIDTSTEWHSYIDGMGSFTLPLICVIDPGDATAYLDRSTATQSASVFRDRLTSHLPTNAIDTVIVRTPTSRLQWATESELHYRVLKSEDLRSWAFAGFVIPGTGSPVQFEDESAADRCFYRVIGFR